MYVFALCLGSLLEHVLADLLLPSVEFSFDSRGVRFFFFSLDFPRRPHSWGHRIENPWS